MDYTLIPVWSSVITARPLSPHHCRDAAISHRMAPDSPHVSASRVEKVGTIEPGSPTTFCMEFGFCSSHSMSREPDDGSWWWHGKVALSPTTFFISVWAAAGSRLSRTEEEKETEMSDQDAGSEKKKNIKINPAERQRLRIGSQNVVVEEIETERRSEKCDPESRLLSDGCWEATDSEKRDNRGDFFLFKEIEFGRRGQRGVLWCSFSTFHNRVFPLWIRPTDTSSTRTHTR